ncbi:MAG: hypothetical protein JO029_11310 [Candidatus Eremiobacteraeota bacterium]|nr:hypothetical protein [Candidatus Eremiobacteraeota bacterium]MBV8434856.1 hypothetical protein [Candidatus Eremiobacteraeota bacterium]MBV8722391.1 hypothetical protein [Candidatus Eremiobacteraeota bacterium]
MSRPNALLATIVCTLVCLSAVGAAPPPTAQGDVDSGCAVSGGTLTMLATDNESDFAAFALLNERGDEMARQFIPMFSQDASAELMLTPIGFGPNAGVSSVKCLADSNVRRCGDAKWAPVDQGVGVSIAGMLLGPDWAVLSIKGRYVNVASPIAGSIDGASIGFALDGAPVRWSTFYDSQTEASQAFFNLSSGDHRLTIGSRDAERDTLVPQDRLCFNL